MTARPDYSPIDFDAALARKNSARDETIAMLETQAKESAVWLVGQRRDGIIPPADMIVLDCLCKLQAIPAAERWVGGPDVLTDRIAFAYLASSCGEKERMRRIAALLRISAEPLK